MFDFLETRFVARTRYAVRRTLSSPIVMGFLSFENGRGFLPMVAARARRNPNSAPIHHVATNPQIRARVTGD